MIRVLRLALVVVGSVVLQTTLFTHLRIDGVAPDVGLVAVLAVAYEDGPETGAWFGFVMGLSVDMFLTTPLGLSALAYALTGYGVGVFRAGMIRSSPVVAPLLGFVGGLAGGLLFLVVGGLAGQSDFLSMHGLRTVVIAAVYDALLAPLIFPVARWAVRRPAGDAVANPGLTRRPAGPPTPQGRPARTWWAVLPALLLSFVASASQVVCS